jgi:hypothetical protein
MPISIPADIHADCCLERWNAASQARRATIAETIRISLNFEGYEFEAWRIENHGPDSEQPVLLLTDTRTHLDFALIPGGTLHPGYDEAQLAHLDEIYHLLEAWKADFFHGDKYDEAAMADEWEPDTPERMPIFASEAPCDLRRKPPVEICPFLMAVIPALAETPEIQQVVSLPEWREEIWAEMEEDYAPMELRWPMVAPVLDHYRWELPTTQEWEWAVQGGIPGLFYWGNLLPEFVVNPYEEDEDEENGIREEDIDLRWLESQQRNLQTSTVQFDDVMRLTFPPDKARIWPYANRFGLVGMLAWGDWCMPSVTPDDPYPLIIRGGAAGSFPWQACGEWHSLLSAAEGRQSVETRYGDWNVLRPILHLLA